MKKGLILGLVLAFAVSVPVVQAGPGCGGKTACGAKKAGCEGSSQAVMAKLAKSLPSLTYQVGDFTTHCGKQAAQKAEETNASIVYVVGEERFETEAEASARVADLLEAEVAKLASVQYIAGDNCYGCPMAASQAANGAALKYTVAGYTFESKEQAEKAAEVVSAALAKMADGQEPGKTGCASSCAGKAQTASAEGKTGCGSPCGAKAQTASAEGKTGCPASCGKAQTASAEGKTGCGSPCGAKAQPASAEGKTGCGSSCGAKAQTASAAGGCAGSDACKDKPVKCCTPERIATAMEKIETMVNAAATVAS